MIRYLIITGSGLAIGSWALFLSWTFIGPVDDPPASVSPCSRGRRVIHRTDCKGEHR